MDGRLYYSVVKGNVSTFRHLFRKNKGVINQVDSPSGNTVLHLAARFGYLKLASLIVKLMPDLVLSKNENLDTPLHEAVRAGRLEILKLFLQVDSSSVQIDSEALHSLLVVADEIGKLDVVNLLRREYELKLMLESGYLTTSFHAASSSGYADVLEERFALKKDSRGCTPLRFGAKPLGLDLYPTSDIHCTTMNVRDNMVNLYNNRKVTRMTANLGVRVLHPGINGVQYEAVGHLERTPNISEIFNTQNGNANTVLDLAPTNMGCRHGIEPNHANASRSHQSQDPAEELWINHLLKSIDINLVAAGLVASLTYPALINPPGGISEISGKAKNGKEAAFHVFLLANTVAFFLAIISIVIILVERKSMVKLSGICGKLTGLAMILVVVAYIASACTILPKGPNTNWVLATLASVGFGSIVITLLGVAVWNKQKRMNALATKQLRHPHLLV